MIRHSRLIEDYLKLHVEVLCAYFYPYSQIIFEQLELKSPTIGPLKVTNEYFSSRMLKKI